MKAKSLLTEFSRERERRIEKAESEGWDYCLCCGKRIKDRTKAVEIEMIDGGDVWTVGESNDINDPGYMGAWWLGPSCYKAWRKTWNNSEKDEDTLVFEGAEYTATPIISTSNKCQGCAFEHESPSFCAGHAELFNCAGNFRQDQRDIIWELKTGNNKTMYAIYNGKGERMYQYPATPYIEEAVSRYLLPARDIYPYAGMHIEQVKEG